MLVDLAPLSPRTALRTNPLSDLDGSTELAEPPLVGMMRPPRTTRHRLERDARAKRLEVRRNTPLPCRTLTLLVPSPRARLPGMGKEIWIRAATWCSWPPRGTWLWNTPSGRAQPRAASKIARAHGPCGDHEHLGVPVRPRKPPARAHGACRLSPNPALNHEKQKQIISGGPDRPLILKTIIGLHEPAQTLI